MEVKGRYGKCVFGDCLELLKDCDHFDVSITDPPYNAHKKKDKHYLNGTYKKYDGYNDNFTIKEYEIFSKKWFDLLVTKASKVIFTPGYNNDKWWRHAYQDMRMGIWIKNNGESKGDISNFCKYEPLLFYGNIGNNSYNKNIFDVYLDSGFLKKCDILHPHPKPIKLYEELLLPLKPRSVIDPFLGSGTTSCICEKYGIPWFGIEILKDYKRDIEMYIEVGMQEHEKIARKTIF